MSEFKKLSVSECADRLLALTDVAVAMHVRPDGDTAGSCAALLEILMQLGKKPVYICHDEIPKRLAFILEGYEKGTPHCQREVVAIDVASPSQLGSLYETDLPILSIDHHEMNTPYCDNYTVSSASSAGEVLYAVAKELMARGKIRMTKALARALYTAISSDTGGFMYSNAAKSTYICAAELISEDIDHAEINRRLFSSKSAELLRAEGFAAANLRTSKDGRISYVVISKSDRDALSLPMASCETAIDVARSLMGAEIAFVVKENDKGEYKASLRSTGANVAGVAALHSGGGHIRAAGCTVAVESAEAAASILLSELEELIS